VPTLPANVHRQSLDDGEVRFTFAASLDSRRTTTERVPLIADLPSIPVVLDDNGCRPPRLALGGAGGRDAEAAREVPGAGGLGGEPESRGRSGGDAGGDEDVGSVRGGPGSCALSEHGRPTHDDELGRGWAAFGAGGSCLEHTLQITSVGDLAGADSGRGPESLDDRLVAGDHDGGDGASGGTTPPPVGELADRFVASRTEGRHHRDADTAELARHDRPGRRPAVEQRCGQRGRHRRRFLQRRTTFERPPWTEKHD
jgi:hypothetical protein